MVNHWKIDRKMLLLLVVILYIITTVWFSENRAAKIYHRYYISCMIEMKQMQAHRDDIKDPANGCRRLAYSEARTARATVLLAGLMFVMPILSWAYSKKFENEEVT